MIIMMITMIVIIMIFIIMIIMIMIMIMIIMMIMSIMRVMTIMLIQPLILPIRDAGFASLEAMTVFTMRVSRIRGYPPSMIMITIKYDHDNHQV